MPTRKLATLTHLLVITGTLGGLVTAAASCVEPMGQDAGSGTGPHQTLAERN